MQSLGWYWRRVRSMDALEIAWRAKCLLRDQFDAVRIPLKLVPGMRNPVRIPFAEFEPGFSCSPLGNQDWSDDAADIRSAWRSRLLAKADLALENRFSYFDLEAVDHGDPINWHRDHSAGINAPVALSLRTDYRDFSTFGDCKLVWEPNRHHQLVVLARAYVVTNERKYAEKIAELLESWIDANPFGYGMNWKSPLEIGVRLINWVWAIDLTRSSGVYGERLWQQILQNVQLAVWECGRKYSRGSSANNHLVGEAAGVYIACSYFDKLPHAAHLRRAAKDVLEREILAQTYPDGCTREHAFGYQFFVIQFLFLCMQTGEATGDTWSRQFRDRLLEMYRFVDELSADTGKPPNMGDADDGYVLDLGELPGQARELISVAGHYFDDPSLVLSAASETAFWLFGKPARSAPGATKTRNSRYFEESGYAILRTDRLSVFFDCAVLGYGPIAAHGHADCLSFCLAVDGQPVFVDPGTYDYFSYPKWRNYFRETRAHNTVEIDGRSQSENLGPFMWGKRAKPGKVSWSDAISTTAIEATHDGYERLHDPVSHHRGITVHPDTESVTILDTLASRNEHQATLHFHLDPLCDVEERSDNEVGILLDGNCITMRFDKAGKLSVVRAGEDGPGWTSDGYHRKQPASLIKLELRFAGNLQVRTDISLG